MSRINNEHRNALNLFRGAFRGGVEILPAPTDPAQIDAANLALVRNRFRLDGLSDEQVRDRFPSLFPNRDLAPTPGASDSSGPGQSPPTTLAPSPPSPTPDAAPEPTASRPFRPRDNDGPRFRRLATPPATVPANYTPGAFMDGVA